MSRYVIVIISLLLVLLLYSLMTSNNTIVSASSYRKISFQKMYEILKEGDLILDVRTDEEYAAGHISNSVLIPDYEINTIQSKYVNKDITIFVYCRTGHRSKNAVMNLLKLGYKNVYDVGGIIDYPYTLEK